MKEKSHVLPPAITALDRQKFPVPATVWDLQRHLQQWESHLERMEGDWRYSEAQDDEHDDIGYSHLGILRTEPCLSNDISSVCGQAVIRCDGCLHSPLQTAAEPRYGGQLLECAPRPAGSVPKPDTFHVPPHDPLIPIIYVPLCLLTSFSFICTFLLSLDLRHHWTEQPESRSAEYSMLSWCSVLVLGVRLHL